MDGRAQWTSIYNWLNIWSWFYPHSYSFFFFSFSFNFLSNTSTLEGRCKYFRLPVHSYVQWPFSRHFWHLMFILFSLQREKQCRVTGYKLKTCLNVSVYSGFVSILAKFSIIQYHIYLLSFIKIIWLILIEIEY